MKGKKKENTLAQQLTFCTQHGVLQEHMLTREKFIEKENINTNHCLLRVPSKMDDYVLKYD